ncbi:MAG: epoxyqueuosine reductase QueH, partial [Bacteroidales bacterium]|nr:epoxyqueuosine reductase QueH [Bacteroidales bacterium]
CSICYRMRLEETARKAAEMRCAYFASTLTLSPKKNSTTINRCGFEIQELSPLQYLPSDFKKNNGFLRSIALCNTYNLYRQTYCGCIYSNPAASKPSIAISD